MEKEKVGASMSVGPDNLEQGNSKSCDKLQVLIVDDSGFSRRMINKELNAIGISDDQIQQSGTGDDAFGKIQVQQFDLFILDIIMDGIDGISVLKEVKKNQPNAKVIMCSGSNSDEIIADLIELGIDAFIVKPYESEVFKKAVCRTLAMQQACCCGVNDYWIAKCHKCDAKMIEMNLINTVSFFCPHKCMTIGPIMNVLVNQNELNEDYNMARQKRNNS